MVVAGWVCCMAGGPGMRERRRRGREGPPREPPGRLARGIPGRDGRRAGSSPGSVRQRRRGRTCERGKFAYYNRRLKAYKCQSLDQFDTLVTLYVSLI